MAYRYCKFGKMMVKNQTKQESTLFDIQNQVYSNKTPHRGVQFAINYQMNPVYPQLFIDKDIDLLDRCFVIANMKIFKNKTQNSLMEISKILQNFR